MMDPLSTGLAALPPPPHSTVCRDRGAGAASRASAVTRGQDPAPDLSNAGSRDSSSARNASSHGERREAGGEGLVVSKAGAGSRY